MALTKNSTPRRRKVVRLTAAFVAVLLLGSGFLLFFLSNAPALWSLRNLHHDWASQSTTELAYFARPAFKEHVSGHLAPPTGTLQRENGCWVVTGNLRADEGPNKSLVVTELGRLLPHEQGIESARGSIVSEGDQILGYNGWPATFDGIKAIPKTCQDYDRWFYVLNYQTSKENLATWRQ